LAGKESVADSGKRKRRSLDHHVAVGAAFEPSSGPNFGSAMARTLKSSPMLLRSVLRSAATSALSIAAAFSGAARFQRGGAFVDAEAP
jgi:hypothetical protein